MQTQTKTIAVSGAPGSFSEEAGMLYAQRMGVTPQITFAVDMEGVLKAVDSGETELGIFPVVNSRGGLVHMAFDAMAKYTFRMIDELWFEVYQCIMTLPGTKLENIDTIASHPQAIAQCDRYLKQYFPNAKIVVWEDTAKAAKDLHEGRLSKNTAVIAPSRSAQLYELDMIEGGIQDEHPNLTTFIIVEKV